MRLQVQDIMAIKKNRDRALRFSPISFEEYVALHVEANRDENERDFRQRLKDAVSAKRAGQLCECGEPIWAIGSAAAHYACFTCLTGEVDPSDDYEIHEAL
jgi:hypothetical protein